jgi:hypothetical protein
MDVEKSAMDYGFQQAGLARDYDQIGANAWNSLNQAGVGYAGVGANYADAWTRQNQTFLQQQQAAADDAWRQALEQGRRADQDLEWERGGRAAAEYEQQQRLQQQAQQRQGDYMTAMQRTNQVNQMLDKQLQQQLLRGMTMGHDPSGIGLSPQYIEQYGPSEYVKWQNMYQKYGR